MWRLLRYIMGLNRLQRKYGFMLVPQLSPVMVAALDEHMAKFPMWAGAFLPPLQDSTGNIMRWINGVRVGS